MRPTARQNRAAARRFQHQKRREYYYKITVHVRTHTRIRCVPVCVREKEIERQRAGTSIVNKHNVIYRSYLVTQTYFTMCTERQATFYFTAAVAAIVVDDSLLPFLL